MKTAQMFPHVYYTEYETNNHKEVAIWKMRLGHAYDVKR